MPPLVRDLESLRKSSASGKLTEAKNQSGGKWKSNVDWVLGDMYFKVEGDATEVPEADDEVQEKLKRKALFNKHLSGAAEGAAASEE